MTWILGISAFYHDSAVALVKDGELVYAASEERFTRKKHDESFPGQALEAGLKQCGIGVGDLDYVGFYEKPLLKFDRLLETYLAFAPRGYRSFAKAMPTWLHTKLHLPREIRAGLGGQYKRRIVFCEHHESHAASAFYASPFDEAAILTVDGVGEWATTTWGIGEGNRIELKGEIRFPHSLGLLYSAFTYFCGFRVNSGEYKLMGLAPYGEPKYAQLIRENLVSICDDGSYRLDMRYFGYCHTLHMTTKKFEKLFGVQRRSPEAPVRQIDMDLAASVQVVTEEIMLKMSAFVRAETGKENLCLAGGVALNCVANGRLARESDFTRVWAQPASGDAGGASGVALLIWYQLLNKSRFANPNDAQSGSLLGTDIDEEREVADLVAQGAVCEHFPDESQLFDRVAKFIADGKVVGWAQGKMEFGPRALGSRSILGDPRNTEMQTTMNLKIKYRESFRPFAPAVLEECAADCFEMPAQHVSSPYMLFTFDVQQHRRLPVNGDAAGLDRVRQLRSDLPAITHLDYSARVQTVSPERHRKFHGLLQRFYELTGCPALINTSFNVRGEPIVRTAADAYRCFLATQMDVLVIENTLFIREAQPQSALQSSQEYLTELEPD